MAKALSLDLRVRVLKAVAEGASHRALAELGHAFGYGTLQRFFRHHGLTRKKRLAMRPSRTAPRS